VDVLVVVGADDVLLPLEVVEGVEAVAVAVELAVVEFPDPEEALAMAAQVE
jgi:hypothetical protein